MAVNLLEKPIIGRLNLSGFLACAGIIGPLVFVVTEGNIHLTSAKCVIWMLPMAILFMVPTLKRESFWRSLFFYSIISSVASFLLMLSSLGTQDDFKYFGLFERILVFIKVSWGFVIAVWLLRLSIINTNANPNSSITNPI
jgi:hypothetical protein